MERVHLQNSGVLWRLNIFILPTYFCLWLVELSADCVHSPTSIWLGSSLISNPVEVFPVFVWSLEQISWKYKLSKKTNHRTENWGKCFSTWLHWYEERLRRKNIFWVTMPETTEQQKSILCKRLLNNLISHHHGLCNEIQQCQAAKQYKIIIFTI